MITDYVKVHQKIQTAKNKSTFPTYWGELAVLDEDTGLYGKKPNTRSFKVSFRGALSEEVKAGKVSFPVVLAIALNEKGSDGVSKAFIKDEEKNGVKVLDKDGKPYKVLVIGEAEEKIEVPYVGLTTDVFSLEA